MDRFIALELWHWFLRTNIGEEDGRDGAFSSSAEEDRPSERCYFVVSGSILALALLDWTDRSQTACRPLSMPCHGKWHRE